MGQAAKNDADKPLNPFELAVVEAAEKLPLASQSAIARYLNRAPATVHHHLRKPNVQSALALRAEKRSDKARGELGRMRRILQKTGKKVEQAIDNDDCKVVELGALMKLSMELIEKAEALKLTGGDTEQLELFKKEQRRCLKLGKYLRDREIRALDVVVADTFASPPTE